MLFPTCPAWWCSSADSPPCCDACPAANWSCPTRQREYALAVLQMMGVDSHFDALHCIESTGYQPKPSLAAFRSLLRAHGLIASRCIMVEDSRENLRPAKRLGMKTVWVTREPRAPAYVDVKIASVLALPRLLGRLGT